MEFEDPKRRKDGGLDLAYYLDLAQELRSISFALALKRFKKFLGLVGGQYWFNR
jgi:hypothetical protein